MEGLAQTGGSVQEIFEILILGQIIVIGRIRDKLPMKYGFGVIRKRFVGCDDPDIVVTSVRMVVDGYNACFAFVVHH
jgi:hypothetical protein